MLRFAFAASLLLAGASIPMAGESLYDSFGDDVLLGLEDHEVYVVEVLKVEDEGATQERPPQVSFRIKEALRGIREVGSEMEALWMPVGHGIDTTGREDELEAWRAEPMEGPAKGEVFIVMILPRVAGWPVQTSYRCRYPFTEKKRDEVAACIAGHKKAKEDAARARADAVAKRKEEDLPALEKIDAAAAARDAAIIVVGKLSFADPRYGNQVWLSPDRYLKGADEELGKLAFFQLDMPITDDQYLTLEARSGTPVIAFFCVPNNLDNLHRGLPLHGGVNGILPATPERLKAVRVALGLPVEEE